MIPNIKNNVLRILNLLLFSSARYGKYGVMIGLEALTKCFVQAHIAHCQAKSQILASTVRIYTSGNIPVTNKKSYNCIYSPNMLKTYRRETKLFEFSRDISREELKIS